jgi:hypothetical protein
MRSFKGPTNTRYTPQKELLQAKAELANAEAELTSLQQELERFETLLDTSLGALLDQLSILDGEVQTLTAQINDLREARLFGKHRATYYGAGFTPPSNPVIIIEHPSGCEETFPTADPQVELKSLFRRLARRFHPDLARSESARKQLTEQMIIINQAYSEGDLSQLRTLAGITAPVGAPLHAPNLHPPTIVITELEEVQMRLRRVREQIDQLQALPTVQLSLEIKLARRQGRNLLAEKAADLKRKIARKIAERDYLRSQLDHA